jgi:chromosome segregation ATPase
MARVETSIGHNTTLSNSILLGSGTILFTGLFVYNRRVSGLQDRALAEARESRDVAADTARRIENEIDSIRGLLREVEPAKGEHREEVARLQSEQQELQAKLDALAAREHELRGQADRAAVLAEDSHALEELLEEATSDLDAKNATIRELEKRLKRERKNVGPAGGKSREKELLAKRLRSLYPNIDIDERAIDGLIDLQDEATKLRAEECLKRLGEDADNVRIRRKVGGLPNHLSIYELGFAGKRRIYYANVQNGRFRVFVVGAKNTQQTDLDYLARIPKGEIIS